MVTPNVPETVGVPEMIPVAASRFMPDGSPAALKLCGALSAVIWYVRAHPSVPVTVSALVMLGADMIVSTSVAEPVPPPVSA